MSRSVTVADDRTWRASCNGHLIPVDAPFLSTIPRRIATAQSLQNLLEKVENGTVCSGNTDAEFVEMINSKRGKATAADGKTTVAYVEGDGESETVRTTACRILINGGKCDICSQYRSTLRKARSRWLAKKSSPERRTSSSSRTNIRYLDTPERQSRFKSLRSCLNAAERKLKNIIKKQTEENGVDVEPDTHKELHQIMTTTTSEVRNETEEGTFRRIFWKQQLQALQVKNPRQIRWHPAMMCLHLKYKSSSAYQSFRNSGALTLPTERTLFDYNHWSERPISKLWA